MSQKIVTRETIEHIIGITETERVNILDALVRYQADNAKHSLSLPVVDELVGFFGRLRP